MTDLDRDFWEDRYRAGTDRWDLGGPSPPLAAYIDGLPDKDLRILVPGGGRGYEAEYLFRAGFENLTIVDLARRPLDDLRRRLPELPAAALQQTDFFSFRGGPFDLILEHTFFCALPPARRPDYVQAMHRLLVPGGRLAGLFFDFPLTEDGPPFGGSETEYRNRFSSLFHIRKLERARNSIPPRAGTELFFIFEKK
ncbi:MULTISPECIES: methyltransferase domain-containing protein [unclassified Robiginitalea]|jgi:thiopurine S-methyltransferase|uniref:methyltransferase domain-containing protein n=1 Tax=Robiginitalea TaxID=252306 RepID=UPI002349BA3C|nr:MULTISPECIES: methyltransferase domain-containing protein [unclassified Robiginitalea]MDC6353622.1 methyltransferase domain-containing protein [Robiginitalea sp. PM2]MDC6375696.1 methyltransferase domain-containing protein [Robiginitalea sp. SP8]